MHSMVGALAPYQIKRRRVEIVRGYWYRFTQCSFPCGIIMLIFSLLFIIFGSIQLIYIFNFNGCNILNTRENEISTTDIISISSSSSFKCNRHTMKVLGITFVVSGSVLFLISLLVIKYSRSSEENNIIRTTTTSLITNNTKHNLQHHPHHNHPHPPHHHHHHQYCPHTISSCEHDQNHIIVSTR